MNELHTVAVAAVAFVVTAVLGVAGIPLLRRLRFGQSIREVGPTWHKGKQGTPTMGGILFIVGILAAMGLFLILGLTGSQGAAMTAHERAMLGGGVFMALGYGFVGFMDDYIKVVKKRNLGLTVRQKLVLQFLVAAVILVIEYCAGQTRTIFIIPFANWQWDLHLFYWPVSVILIVGMVNAVNITDGIDGLCGSVTFVAALAMMLCARIVQMQGFAVLAAALAGGCLGFLVWNLHPAKVFMGDTGSLFLGGMLCALCFGVGLPILLLPVGLVYVCEILSVVIQVISFKTTGKRVFRMSPIHHHFELCKWSETKIVVIFSGVGLAAAVLSVVWVAHYYSIL